jgi:hypothetical protein
VQKLETEAKLAAGPFGSIWMLTPRMMKAKSACEFAHASCVFTAFQFAAETAAATEECEMDAACEIVRFAPIENRRSKIENELAERIGIEPTSARRMPNQQRF